MMRIGGYIAGESLFVIKVDEKAFPVRGIIHSLSEAVERLRVDFRCSGSQLASGEAPEWDPLVTRSRDLHDGEMGRGIFVRWDLTTGPDRDAVVFCQKKRASSMALPLTWPTRPTWFPLRDTTM